MKRQTSWQNVSKWYDKIVGQKGHYYHETVIMPGVNRLLALKPNDSILDLACGQGILGRQVENNNYLGVDISPDLVDEARKLDKNIKHRYLVGDICQTMSLKETFDKAVIILGLQNLENPFKAIRNITKHLRSGGETILIINHPAFRIPKHSDWVIRDGKQCRLVDCYLSSLKIPIDSSPFNQKNNQTTWSFHHSISKIAEMIEDNGLFIKKIEEWSSLKKSTGPMAAIEDTARKEIPLFMAIVATKP